VRVEGDGKGLTNKPHQRLVSDLAIFTPLLMARLSHRLRHGLYEDMEPLFANLVLAITLADDAFTEYRSFEEIEAILPPADGSLHRLRIKKKMHTTPVFQVMSPDGPTVRIVSANTLGKTPGGYGSSRRIYPEDINVHYMRREAPVKADSKSLGHQPRFPRCR
jgi:hypothetical protein